MEVIKTFRVVDSEGIIISYETISECLAFINRMVARGMERGHVPLMSIVNKSGTVLTGDELVQAVERGSINHVEEWVPPMDGFEVEEEDLFYAENDEELDYYVHHRQAILPIDRPQTDSDSWNPIPKVVFSGDPEWVTKGLEEEVVPALPRSAVALFGNKIKGEQGLNNFQGEPSLNKDFEKPEKPFKCVNCTTPVELEGSLCSECWQGLQVP